MSDRRPATTIGELDIHVGNVIDKLDQVQQTLTTLATKNYVDEQVRLVNEKIHASKPSTQLKSAAAVLAALAVVASFFVVVYDVMVVVRDIKQMLPAKTP